MYNASDLKKGLKIQIDGAPWAITEFEFCKPGKGTALYRCKMKNMINGSGMEKTYRPTDKIEKPDLEEREVYYSYAEGDSYIFPIHLHILLLFLQAKGRSTASAIFSIYVRSTALAIYLLPSKIIRQTHAFLFWHIAAYTARTVESLACLGISRHHAVCTVGISSGYSVIMLVGCLVRVTYIIHPLA